MGVSVHQCSVKNKWMAGTNQLSTLMLCILEVYSPPPSYLEQCGGLSSPTATDQWLNCTDRAVRAAWNRGWAMPPKAVLRSHLLHAAGRDWEGAVSWPHVSNLCPSDYTMTKGPCLITKQTKPNKPHRINTGSWAGAAQPFSQGCLQSFPNTYSHLHTQVMF